MVSEISRKCTRKATPKFECYTQVRHIIIPSLSTLCWHCGVKSSSPHWDSDMVWPIGDVLMFDFVVPSIYVYHRISSWFCTVTYDDCTKKHVGWAIQAAESIGMLQVRTSALPGGFGSLGPASLWAVPCLGHAVWVWYGNHGKASKVSHQLPYELIAILNKFEVSSMLRPIWMMVSTCEDFVDFISRWDMCWPLTP